MDALSRCVGLRRGEVNSWDDGYEGERVRGGEVEEELPCTYSNADEQFQHSTPPPCPPPRQQHAEALFVCSPLIDSS